MVTSKSTQLTKYLTSKTNRALGIADHVSLATVQSNRNGWTMMEDCSLITQVYKQYLIGITKWAGVTGEH